MKKYFFVSDLHLGLQDKEEEEKKEKLFVEFLKFAKTEADELFILGDLFDYWFEYRRAMQKGFYRTLAGLKELTEAGVKVHYFIGNHDFLHRDFFETEIGTLVYKDSVIKELNGKKFFLAHGDGMVKNDIGYKILKKILRNKFLQRMYSYIHPDIGIAVASSTSKKSRDYTAEKNYGEIDGLFEAAKNKIDDGIDYVIFGHSHVRSFENYKSGKYINLGSWLSQPGYGIFKENSFEIIDWK